MNNFYPMKLSGIPKETIWGGDRIARSFESSCTDKTGELWVLSARSNEDCLILNGIYTGMTLTEFIKSFMPELIPFPLLIKFIDANDRLSVQVHPDDETAAVIGGSAAGKTEMWHIIDAVPGATIVYGIKDEVSINDLKNAVDGGYVESLMNFVTVKPGDTFFIPAGLVHAIGKGILLAEVQQNSDTTYRFYDYGRLDKNGNPRELHVEKALASTKLLKENEISDIRFASAERIDGSVLADCEYFKVIKKSINGDCSLDIGDAAFGSLICLSGNATISHNDEDEKICAGDSVFLPRDVTPVKLSGRSELLVSIPKK